MVRGRHVNRKKVAGILALVAIARYLKRRKRNARRFWIRPFLLEKPTDCLLRMCIADDHGLSDADLLTRGYFKAFIRIQLQDFKKLHSDVYPLLKKNVTNFRLPISPLEKLCITLRFLSTGDNFDTLEKLFRVSKAAISILIPQTCRALILVLQEYIKTPENAQEWKNIASHFQSRWNFPNCIGAIDGRHCPIISPQFSGSDFYNYKNFFSIVLLAIVDADYNFIYIDVGAQGRISDGGIFQKCSLSQQLENEELHIPEPSPILGTDSAFPYVFVADEAFPLKENIMKPIRGHTEEDSPERIFNYRLSRARRVVENSFGIMSARFRILRKPMNLNPDTATLIILTCCYLHNFIRRTSQSSAEYTPPGFADNSDDIIGAWRNEAVHGPLNGLYSWRNYPRKSSGRAKQIRANFMQYFSSPEGMVPWPIPYH